MPHIPLDRRALCLELPNVKNRGELHYFFGKQMEREFLRLPSYDTLSAIRKFFVQTAHQQDYFKKIRQAIRVPMGEVLNEAAFAWEQFSSSVVVSYEDHKAKLNSHAYEDALHAVALLANEGKK